MADLTWSLSLSPNGKMINFRLSGVVVGADTTVPVPPALPNGAVINSWVCNYDAVHKQWKVSGSASKDVTVNLQKLAAET